MDINLLEREAKYRRLNEEFERQSQSLMSELESASKRIGCNKTNGKGMNGKHSEVCKKVANEAVKTVLNKQHSDRVILGHSSIDKEYDSDSGSKKSPFISKRCEIESKGPTFVDEGDVGDTKTISGDNDVSFIFNTSERNFKIDRNSDEDPEYDGSERSSASPKGLPFKHWPKKGLSSDSALVKVLQAKLNLLQKEFNELKKNYVNKFNECRDLQAAAKKNNEEMGNLVKTLKNSSEVKEKIEANLSSVTQKTKDYVNENRQLKKEIETLSRELNKLKTSKNNDIRFNRTLEELASLKTGLKKSLENQRILKEEKRKKEEELSRTLLNTERQRNEILASFKKQLRLIQNLKKQNNLKEVADLAKCSEANYVKILESTLK